LDDEDSLARMMGDFVWRFLGKLKLSVVRGERVPQTNKPKANERTQGEAEDVAIPYVHVGVTRPEPERFEFEPPILLLTGPECIHNVKPSAPELMENPIFAQSHEWNHFHSGQITQISERLRFITAQNRDLRRRVDLSSQNLFGNLPHPFG